MDQQYISQWFGGSFGADLSNGGLEDNIFIHDHWHWGCNVIPLAEYVDSLVLVEARMEESDREYRFWLFEKNYMQLDKLV